MGRTIIEVIETANKEFDKNGRSEAFIKLENDVISNGKPAQIYFFARYTKGVDVIRLQQELLKRGSLEQCYYYQLYVEGAQLRPFVKRAVEENDTFWVEKGIELATDYFDKEFPELAVNERYKHIQNSEKIKTYNDNVLIFNDIQDLIMGFKRKEFDTNVTRRKFNIDLIIGEANKEYRLRGRSKYFQYLEKCTLHSNGDANIILFAKNVRGANIKSFERVAVYRGDPFSMYFIANEIYDSNKSLMLEGLQLSRLDYKAIDESRRELVEQKRIIFAVMRKTKSEIEISKLYKKYYDMPEMSEYEVRLDKIYIPNVRYLIRNEGKFKK
jgi:hypothetical protein